VTFTPEPAAVDSGAPHPVSCTPQSRSLFPLGTTTVSCSVVDVAGAKAQGSFNVVVRDTTPPVLTVPPPITLPLQAPVSSNHPLLVELFSRVRATDIVDADPRVSLDVRDVLPYGTTTVNVVAVDAAGNSASGALDITIVAPAPAQPPPVLPPDDPPPGDVRSLRATAGSRTVRLTWQPPADRDIARYVVTRTAPDGLPVEVASGAATSVVDRGLTNGVEYRYVVVAVDRAGKTSAGAAVSAKPRVPMLLKPRAGGVVRKPPMLTWRGVTRASYYNVQLFYEGVRRSANGSSAQKVLSTWPVKPRLKLRVTWRFEGRRYRLRPGVYRWYVWPGFGARARVNYGTLLGSSTFVVRGGR